MKALVLLLVLCACLVTVARTQSSDVIEISTSNFNQLYQGEWMFEVYAPWCGFCKRLAPAWEELATRIKDASLPIKVARVNADEPINSGIARRFYIRGFPTIFHIKDGEVRLYPASQLQQPHSVETLFNFAKEGWQNVEPYPFYYSPLSPVGWFVEVSTVAAQPIEALMTKANKEYGIPMWGLVTAVLAAVFIGTIIFIVIVERLLTAILGPQLENVSKKPTAAAADKKESKKKK